MGWDKGGRYYTRSKRVNGKVVREHIGGGEAGRLAAQQDALEREKRQAELAAERAKQAEIAALDAQVDELNELVDLLFRAYLMALGYRQHNRGEWRKRRVRRQKTPAQPCDVTAIPEPSSDSVEAVTGRQSEDTASGHAECGVLIASPEVSKPVSSESEAPVPVAVAPCRMLPALAGESNTRRRVLRQQFTHENRRGWRCQRRHVGYGERETRVVYRGARTSRICADKPKKVFRWRILNLTPNSNESTGNENGPVPFSFELTRRAGRLR